MITLYLYIHIYIYIWDACIFKDNYLQWYYLNLLIILMCTGCKTKTQPLQTVHQTTSRYQIFLSHCLQPSLWEMTLAISVAAATNRNNRTKEVTWKRSWIEVTRIAASPNWGTRACIAKSCLVAHPGMVHPVTIIDIQWYCVAICYTESQLNVTHTTFRKFGDVRKITMHK